MSYAPASAVTRRFALLTALVVLALTVFAQSALASTAEVNGTELDYMASAGETNNVLVAFNGSNGEVTLTDSGVATLPVPDNTGADGANCTRPTNTTIVCTGLTSGYFTLDDMNDTLDASQIPSPGRITAYGEAGNDTLTGGAGEDSLYGDAGTDTLNGGGGNDNLEDTSDAGDTLNGGGGDDYFYLGSSVDGTDTYSGGDGVDSLDYSSRTTSLTANLANGTEATTGGAESDSIAGFENLFGPASLGANNITGDDQANDLEGGPGHDVINGAGGNDVLVGSGTAGNDIDGGTGDDEIYGDVGADNLIGGDGADLLRVDDIRVEDDNVDTVACGDGSDNLTADRTTDGDLVNDTFGADCETVNGVGSGGSTGGGGTTTPVTTPAPTPITTPPVTTPPPVVFTLGAFVASKQQSPKANKVAGSATIATDGSSLEVDVFNGKPSKKTLVGKLVKKGLKKGVTPFVVTLNKKAAKAAAKKKKGVKMTVKVTIKPPTGSAFVKTFKVTVKKGKAPACFRAARVRAHSAC